MSRLQMEDLSSFPSTASSSQEDHENNSGSISYRKLKVTLLSSEWRSTKGDVSTINRELGIPLAKHPSLEVCVYLPQCSEEDKQDATSHNVHLIKAEALPGYNNPVYWLSFLPEGQAVDCVIGYGAVLGRQVQLIKRHHKCKWIQIVHTAPEELGMYRSHTILRAEKLHQDEVKLCEKADQVVAVGPKLADVFRRDLRSCRKDQDVLDLTPGIFSEFADVMQATEERKTFSVLMFGPDDNGDFKLNGYDIAARAIAELKYEPQPYKLFFVGAPRGEEEKVKDLLLQQGIDRRQLTVRCFCESREKLARLFCEVDLAIMPSRTEGFGLATLEALSAGLPVLVSGNSGLGEALKGVLYGSSYVVESDDPNVWAKAIKAVRQKDRKMRLNEIQIVRNSYALKYNWGKECDKLVERMSNITRGGFHATVPEPFVSSKPGEASNLYGDIIAKKRDRRPFPAEMPRREKEALISLSKVNSIPGDTIGNLKEKIKDKKGFPAEEQCLFFQREELKDDRTVSDYKIQNKSTVILSPQIHRLEVTILSGGTRLVTLEVNPTDSILELKREIQNITGVPPRKQSLRFDGIELKNERKIFSYNIQNNSYINLVEQMIKVYVFNPLTQEKITLVQKPRDTIGSVKDNIYAQTKISSDRQVLQFYGRELDDGNTLKCYDIKSNSQLLLYEAVVIFVEMLNGTKVKLKFFKSNTIMDVKMGLNLGKDIPWDMQRLSFRGHLLSDSDTLSYVKIQNESILRYIVMTRIHIKMPNKSQISVDVNLDDNIRNVRDRIQSKGGIPRNQLCFLMYNEEKLNNSCTLRHYKLRNGSILSLVKSGGGRAFDALRQIERETKRWTTKLQSNLETIAHEKGFTISENEGGGNCMFIALSEQLGQAKGIEISHEELRQRVVQYLKENPKMPDGTELFHFVHGHPSWDAYLKSMMADGTWGDHVILHGAANCFEMCIHVISSLGHDSDVMICEELDVTGSKRLVLGHVAELHYVSLFPHKGARDWYLGSPLDLFVKVGSQETIALQVYSNDLIGNLKNKIKNKKGFPVETQRIFYDGEVLNDDRTVADCEIQNQSTLILICQGGEIDYEVGFVTKSLSTQDIMNLVAERYLRTMKPSNQEELNAFIEYMEKVRNVIVVGVKSGSLIFTLSCGSVQILDKLWKDYKTGRLNEIAQSYLVTNDVLREFGLSSLKLTSNIKEEDYRACRLRLATIEVTNQTLRSLRAAFFRWITIRGHTKTMLESLVRDLLGEYDTATGNTVGFVMGAGAVAVLAAPFTFGASLVAAAAVCGIGAAIGGQVEKTFRLPMVQRAIDRDRTACRELQRKLISLNRTFTSTTSADALIRNVSRFARASVLPRDISQLVESSLDRHHGSTSPIVQEIRRILNNLKCPDEKEIQRLMWESLID